MTADDYGTLARIAERAQYQNRAYRAPVWMAESDAPKVVAPASETKAVEPAKAEKSIREFYTRQRHATNNHASPQKDHRGRVSDVIVAAAAVFGVPVEDMLSPSRVRRVAYPRFAAMHFLHNVLRISLPSIGTALNRDHTTCLSGIRRAAHLRCDDISFAGHSRLLARELRRKWSGSGAAQ